jgi:hypothetical protein
MIATVRGHFTVSSSRLVRRLSRSCHSAVTSRERTFNPCLDGDVSPVCSVPPCGAAVDACDVLRLKNSIVLHGPGASEQTVLSNELHETGRELVEIKRCVVLCQTWDGKHVLDEAKWNTPATGIERVYLDASVGLSNRERAS